MREADLPDDHLIDLRGVTIHGQQDTAAPGVVLKAVNAGGAARPRGLCIWGGTIVGRHDRDLPWQYLKDDPGGGDHPAVRVAVDGWALVDGIRIDNMMNGFRPDGDGLVIRNAFLRHIRDDCVANDGLHDLRIVDSLFDGCYAAISARPESGSPLWDAGPDPSRMVLDRVLIRLAPMPGGFRVPAHERSYGQLFKWSDVTGPLEVRDSVFLVEAPPHEVEEQLDWPPNVTAEDVTIVWEGPGPFPGRLPASGVVVTRDRGVWEEARADWLRRHGCRSFEDCDRPDMIAALDLRDGERPDPVVRDRGASRSASAVSAGPRRPRT